MAPLNAKITIAIKPAVVIRLTHRPTMTRPNTIKTNCSRQFMKLSLENQYLTSEGNEWQNGGVKRLILAERRLCLDPLRQ
jgi:hypothetical protein